MKWKRTSLLQRHPNAGQKGTDKTVASVSRWAVEELKT